ncbi:hypothetical protein [Streptomyces sp. YGL11-2]|uniref:hypothetical protein n=1 Tax=Streptomyces sp. YGL11-2 TaxID=3414028 RepID=UPI003CF008AD
MEITLALVLVVAELTVLADGYIDGQTDARPSRGIRGTRVLVPLLAAAAVVALVPDPAWKVAVALVTVVHDIVVLAEQGRDMVARTPPCLIRAPRLVANGGQVRRYAGRRRLGAGVESSRL